MGHAHVFESVADQELHTLGNIGGFDLFDRMERSRSGIAHSRELVTLSVCLRYERSRSGIAHSREHDHSSTLSELRA